MSEKTKDLFVNATVFLQSLGWAEELSRVHVQEANFGDVFIGGQAHTMVGAQVDNIHLFGHGETPITARNKHPL